MSWLLAALPSRKAKLWSVAILIALMAAGSTQLSESAISRYKGMLTGGSTESEKESTQGRIEGLQIGWRIFKENPISGVGPGNFTKYRMRHVDGIRMDPHNLAGLLLATLLTLVVVPVTYTLLTPGGGAAADEREHSRDPTDLRIPAPGTGAARAR